eukprot:1156533-Pelagomonas_calceolata.AAC.6
MQSNDIISAGMSAIGGQPRLPFRPQERFQQLETCSSNQRAQDCTCTCKAMTSSLQACKLQHCCGEQHEHFKCA